MTGAVLLLLSLTGAAAGFTAGIFLQPGKAGGDKREGSAKVDVSPTEPAKTTPAEGDSNDTEMDDSDPSSLSEVKVVPIPPVLTTLTEPAGKWIRLEGAILVAPGSDVPPEQLADRAGEQVLVYLRTLRLAQLQGPSGLMAIRDDLNETVQALSGGFVRGILIHGLVIE